VLDQAPGAAAGDSGEGSGDALGEGAKAVAPA
jgi:hypothetical protein